MEWLLQVEGWEIALLEVSELQMPGTDIAPAGVLGELVDLPTNALLLRGHGSTVLVDAGAGILGDWYPSEGPGLQALLGETVPDLAVVTHLDFDHVGGFLTGTWPGSLAPAFPSAPVVLLDDAARSARVRDPDQAWNSATRAVAAFEQVGLLREVADGGEFAPGLRLRSAPGHRTGHAILEVGDSFVHLADVIHHPLHVEHPEWDGEHDGKPEVALRTRIAILNEAADKGKLCVASHVRGSGRIERVLDGVRWAAG